MKPFKTLDEQLILLKSRGLIIENTQKAKEYLLQYSYYNIINVYSKFFQHSPDKYIKGASFDEIRAVHIFDTEMKSIFFKYLIECEKHFKSIVCYRFSEHYRDIPFAYLKTSSYRNENLIDLSTTIALLSKTITTNVRTKKNNAIKHYNNNHKDVPLWVLINYLTFGQVVHMYTNFTNKLKNNIVKDVAGYLEKNLDKKIIIEPQELETFLFNLIDLRNCVAHNNMLFHFKCKRNLTYIEQLHTPFSITRNQPKQDPFNCLIMMQTLLQKEQYAIFHNTVLKRTRNLNVKLTSIPIDTILCSLGFPQSWYESTSRLSQEVLSK
jgi:abortive infection bacteriophage resistance protein